MSDFDAWWRAGHVVDLGDYKGTASKWINEILYQACRQAYAAAERHAEPAAVRELVAAARELQTSMDAILVEPACLDSDREQIEQECHGLYAALAAYDAWREGEGGDA